MRRRYFILDVFTGAPFTGNPLAVVRDCDDLDAAQMQAVAAEFNLSETVFLQSPRDPVNTARARIFTPRRELPFAGHPTIGAAVLIGLIDAGKIIAAQPVDIVLEEQIGGVGRRDGGLLRRGHRLLGKRRRREGEGEAEAGEPDDRFDLHRGASSLTGVRMLAPIVRYV